MDKSAMTITTSHVKYNPHKYEILISPPVQIRQMVVIIPHFQFINRAMAASFTIVESIYKIAFQCFECSSSNVSGVEAEVKEEATVQFTLDNQSDYRLFLSLKQCNELAPMTSKELYFRGSGFFNGYLENKNGESIDISFSYSNPMFGKNKIGCDFTVNEKDVWDKMEIMPYHQKRYVGQRDRIYLWTEVSGGNPAIGAWRLLKKSPKCNSDLMQLKKN